MLLAKVNGVLEVAKKTSEGFCPACNEKLIPKCGTINLHHWSHTNKTVTNILEGV